MPTSPPTRCTYPGCPTLVHSGRCDEHAPIPWARRSQAWGGGSTRRWREFRAEHLRGEPTCRGYRKSCGAPGEHVDHIRPLEQDGAKYDHANAQTLCLSCHQAKTRDEQRSRQRRPRR